MNQSFLAFFNVGVGCSLFILLFIACSAFLDRHCAAKWKRLVWLLVTVRLLLPVDLSAGKARAVVTVPAAVPAGDGVPLLLGPTAGAAPRSLDILGLLAGFWAAGVLLSLAVTFFSYALCRAQLRREGKRPSDPAVAYTLEKEAAACGLRRLPRLLCWPRCETPMVLGLFHPCLVLPGERYSLEELRLIFRHELNHLRRGDLFLKALMAVAKAIHWYNPIIRLLPLWADVDMELSCDDEVTRNYPDAVRKAYSEVLFSFVRRKNRSRAGAPARAITTQFYGGKKIMKKRFSNLFSKEKRKQGPALLAAAAALLLILGSVSACGAAPGTSPAATPAEETPQAPIGEEAVIGIYDPTGDAFGTTPGAPLDGTTPDLPAQDQAQELELLINSFSSSYFGGDAETLKTYLADSYEGSVDVYEGGEIDQERGLTLKGLDGASEAAVGDQVYPSVEFLVSGEESLCYLSITAILQADGWRVSFYGLEG